MPLRRRENKMIWQITFTIGFMFGWIGRGVAKLWIDKTQPSEVQKI